MFMIPSLKTLPEQCRVLSKVLKHWSSLSPERSHRGSAFKGHAYVVPTIKPSSCTIGYHGASASTRNSLYRHSRASQFVRSWWHHHLRLENNILTATLVATGLADGGHYLHNHGSNNAAGISINTVLPPPPVPPNGDANNDDVIDTAEAKSAIGGVILFARAARGRHVGRNARGELHWRAAVVLRQLRSVDPHLRARLHRSPTPAVGLSCVRHAR